MINEINLSKFCNFAAVFIQTHLNYRNIVKGRWKGKREVMKGLSKYKFVPELQYRTDDTQNNANVYKW